MMWICNIATNIKNELFGYKAMSRETMTSACEVKGHLVDKLKDSAADGETKTSCTNGSERVGYRVSC